MGSHMKTTIDLSDSLLQKAKTLARHESTTLRALIEEGLRIVLAKRDSERPVPPRDGRFKGDGLTPEMEAKGGWAKLHEAAYPGFFDDDDEDENEK